MMIRKQENKPFVSPSAALPAPESPSAPYIPMTLALRLVLAFVVANALAAAFSLILFPGGTDAGFFWQLTPTISAGMFGALYLTAGLLVLWAVIKGEWEKARYLAPMIVVFSALMLLSTLLHVHRFDPGIKLSYWVAVYSTALLAGIFFFVQHERKSASWAIRNPRTGQALRVALIVGLLAAAFVAFAYPNPELVAQVWPWELTPLTAQAFLSWVGAFAAGLIWVYVDPDQERTRPVGVMLVLTAVLLLATLVLHRGDLEPRPISVALFGSGALSLGALGAFMLVASRSVRTSKPPSEATHV